MATCAMYSKSALRALQSALASSTTLVNLLQHQNFQVNITSAISNSSTSGNLMNQYDGNAFHAAGCRSWSSTSTSTSASASTSASTQASSSQQPAPIAPSQANETIRQIRERIFGKPLNKREHTGRRALAKKLQGPALTSWYFMPPKNPPGFHNEEREYVLMRNQNRRKKKEDAEDEADAKKKKKK